jgi:hypothetical protein
VLAIGIIRLIEVYYLVASSAALLSSKLPDLPLPRAETAEQTSNSGRIMLFAGMDKSLSTQGQTFRVLGW